MIFLHLLSQCLLLTVWPVSEMIWYSLCTSIKGEKYLWRVGIYGIYKKAWPIPSTKFASDTAVPNLESTKPSLQWCAIEILQQVFIKKFQLFWQPSQSSSETNDTSFESPDNKLLESGEILGVSSFWGWPRPLNWKSTTFTKTRVEPVMIKILPVSNLLSNSG